MPYVMRLPTFSGGDGPDVISYRIWHFNSNGVSADAVDTWVQGGSGDPVVMDNVNYMMGGGSVAVPATGIVDNVTIGSIFAGSWTFEFFFRVPTATNMRQLFTPFGSANVLDFLQSEGSDVLNWTITGVTAIRQVFLTINANQWYHWAMVRDIAAGTYSLYFDGDRVDQISSAFNATAGVGDEHSLVFSGSAGRYDEMRFANGPAYRGTTYGIPSGEFS